MKNEENFVPRRECNTASVTNNTLHNPVNGPINDPDQAQQRYYHYNQKNKHIREGRQDQTER